MVPEKGLIRPFSLVYNWLILSTKAFEIDHIQKMVRFLNGIDVHSGFLFSASSAINGPVAGRHSSG
jgi:hypothetical protein